MTIPGRAPPKAILAISCLAALLIAISIPAATAPPGREAAGVQVPSQLDAAHFAEPLVAAGPTAAIEEARTSRAGTNAAPVYRCRADMEWLLIAWAAIVRS
jgi:hypothetical protein